MMILRKKRVFENKAQYFKDNYFYGLRWHIFAILFIILISGLNNNWNHIGYAIPSITYTIGEYVQYHHSSKVIYEVIDERKR